MTTAATATAAQARVPVPRSGRAEAPSELRASRRCVEGEKQGSGPKAHRRECLYHGCRLEGGATKAPGSRVLFMMALSRRAAGHPGLQGQRPTLRDFFFLA